MTGRLGKKELCSRFRDTGDFGEEAARVGKLVDDGKGESEVDFSGQIVESHGVGRNEAGVNAVDEICFLGAPLQALNHLRLDIDGDNAAGWADKSGKREGEESHAGAGFKHGHTFADVRAEDLLRVTLAPAAHGTDQKVSEPPRANAMRHEIRLEKRR